MDVSLSGLIEQEGAISAYVTVYGIFACYIFLCVAAFVALIFPLIQMFREFKKALFLIGGAGVLVLLFMLCYSMSASETYTTTVGEVKTISAEIMKLVEALLYLLYIVLGLGVFSVLVAPFLKYLK